MRISIRLSARLDHLTVKDRLTGDFAMPHLARAFFIAFLSIAASCSQITQKEDRKEMGRQLAEAYYSCVRTSFASQRPTMVVNGMFGRRIKREIGSWDEPLHRA